MVLKRWLLLLILAGSGFNCAASEVITVAVATNFKSVISELKPQFSEQTGIQLRISSASTGVLYNQIRQGAPFDVFLSADSERPKQLEQQRLIVDGSRQTYALGLLALVSNDQTLVANAGLLRQWQGRLAIANPRIAPYGLAAQQALTKLNRWPWQPSKQSNLVRGNSVAQTYQFFHSGNVKLALVAYAQVKDADNFWLVPRDWYRPIEQQLVTLKASKNLKAATAFVTWLMHSAQQQQIVIAGYAKG